MATEEINFTSNTAVDNNLRRSANIYIVGTWDSATMTITNTKSGATIRTPATADEGFFTRAKDLTFTTTGGGASMDITVYLETTVDAN